LQAPARQQQLGPQEGPPIRGGEIVEELQGLLCQSIRPAGIPACSDFLHRRQVLFDGGLSLAGGLQMGSSACLVS
jgi:hypothetical protein